MRGPLLPSQRECDLDGGITAELSLANVFAEKSAHTLSVINPDSQKAMLKFTVPESQKPS